MGPEETRGIQPAIASDSTSSGFDSRQAPPNLTVVCDGWTQPRHARKVLRRGDSKYVSHGMCDECRAALLGAAK